MCIGCTTPEGLIRGQSPQATQGPPPPPHLTMANSSHRLGGGTRYYGSSYSGANADHANCPHCRSGNCHIHGQHGHNGDGSWRPTHRHFYTYDAPKNLVYPPQNTPAAMVQYPYYTCKAPDDFFMK